MSITDPTMSDTDDDGMIDGFEYWFTSWDLENNRWSMNPLIDSDQWLDSDMDSVDCDRDGNISLDEQFTNKREYESRVYGKYTQRFSTGGGLIGFGDDTIDAYLEEGYTEVEARRAMFNTFSGKDSISSARMMMINTADPNNFNRTLFGISTPQTLILTKMESTTAGSSVTLFTVYQTLQHKIIGQQIQLTHLT